MGMSAATSDNPTGVRKMEAPMPAIESAAPTGAQFGVGRALELLTKLDPASATSALGKAVGTDALSRVTGSTGGVTPGGSTFRRDGRGLGVSQFGHGARDGTA